MGREAPPENGNNGRADGAAAISFKRVRKTFPRGEGRIEALKGISIEIRKGRVTGLVGPDGAGKTTLMRLSVCLLEPDEGALTVMGMDAAEDPLAIQSAVRYMPQQFGLYEDLSVQENLDLYADLQGVLPADRKERYAELTRMTRLGEFTDRLAGRLSGGMKQKLGLACTLVRPPELLILDEPTVGVDPVSRRELWNIVSRLVEEEGMSVLLSTAYLDEAEKCDEVILLHEGEVLGQGPPGDFTREQKGRAYWVKPPAEKKRDIQWRLSRRDGVVDAVIQGDGVRVVMGHDDGPDKEDLLPEENDLDFEPVDARFEDSYVALLQSRQEANAKDMAAEATPGKDDGAGRKTGESPGDSPGDSPIDVENVRRRFGDFYAVKDVSFSVGHGEVFGLLGANGAGKTTTFRMLCGLLPASGGKLRVAGLDLRRAAAKARARIGYMSQKFSLYGNLSVVENLNFFSSAYNLKGKRRQDRIEWALEGFDLKDRADAASGLLPLGYKQRLALACALMHEPEILFLDEPTSGVDPMARREFWDVINALSGSGVTVLVTTHFMEEAEYCDRLAIMAAGEILALGAPAEIKARAGKSEDEPAASMEEAFIALIESSSAARD